MLFFEILRLHYTPIFPAFSFLLKGVINIKITFGLLKGLKSKF